MSVLQFLTKEPFNCCTTSELMELSRKDKEAYITLKKWAEEEMKNRGIPIDGQAL